MAGLVFICSNGLPFILSFSSRRLAVDGKRLLQPSMIISTFRFNTIRGSPDYLALVAVWLSVVLTPFVCALL
jgi:hypothetical protein